MRRIGYWGRAIAAGTLISAEIAIGGEYEVREERAVLEGGIVGIVAQPEGVSDAPAAGHYGFCKCCRRIIEGRRYHRVRRPHF